MAELWQKSVKLTMAPDGKWYDGDDGAEFTVQAFCTDSVDFKNIGVLLRKWAENLDVPMSNGQPGGPDPLPTVES